MIKLVGFGKKRTDMSHEEFVKYHREVHAPMAKDAVGHRGLEKYIAYYVDETFSLEKKVLPERPWNLVIPEWWYTDEFWMGMETWRSTDPDGIKLTENEASFTDQKASMVMLCQENVIVSPEGDSTGVNVIFLTKKKSDMSHEECAKYHREIHAPMVKRIVGSRLKKYVACYVDQAFSAEGPMATRPYDIIVVTRFDYEFWESMQPWRKTPDGIEMTKDEERFMDQKSTIALVCQESIFIP